MPYFNYRVHSSDAAQVSYWQRRDFMQAWRALYREDSRWTPPDYRRLGRMIDPRHNLHLRRLQARLIYIEAMYRTGLRRVRTDQQEIPMTSILEKPLAAAVPLIDPRRKGRTAHVAMLHLSADDEGFDRLLAQLADTYSDLGYRRFIGPVGLSPHLDSGVLVDSWNEWPPVHTPANPPYLPEMLERRMRPFQMGRLYHVFVPTQPAPPAPGPANLHLIDPARLADDLLPLLAAFTTNRTAGFPAPDAVEAFFLLQTLRSASLAACVATVQAEPVGFVLLGADIAGRLRSAQGGRTLLGRGRLAMTLGRPVAAGRLYFGGVQAAWRGRGIGRQLWQWALGEASSRRWQQLTIGPVWEHPNGLDMFLRKYGATPRQTYHLYEATF